jgi:hypothetical protein
MPQSAWPYGKTKEYQEPAETSGAPFKEVIRNLLLAIAMAGITIFLL